MEALVTREDLELDDDAAGFFLPVLCFWDVLVLLEALLEEF